MAAFMKVLFFLSLLFNFGAAAQTCNTYRFDQGKSFAACNDLPTLNCSLHWNYHSSTQKVDIAFRSSGALDEKSSPRWIAWAINPHSKGMIGSQALIAFQRDDGTMAAYTSPIKSYATQLEQGTLSFLFEGVSLIVKNDEMIIFATITLPPNMTTVNHLWQVGPLVNNVPRMHSMSAANIGSMGKLDFLSGKVAVDKSSRSSKQWKIAHGVVCTFGFGFLMPVGSLIARHGKQLGPAWFPAHMWCQCLAYLLGLGGGIVGVLLWVGKIGIGVKSGSHQYIGSVLLGLGAMQGMVGFLRPHQDSTNRTYFKIFHYLMGYGSIALSIANVFLGFHTMHVGVKAWPQITYIAAISFLGVIAIVFEALGWRKRRFNESKTKPTLQQHQVA